MLTAICDKEIRKEFTEQAPDEVDVHMLDVWRFDISKWSSSKSTHQNKAWLTFQQWFQSEKRDNQLRRFKMIQREVACIIDAQLTPSVLRAYSKACGEIAAIAVHTDPLHFCEWYEKQSNARAQFFKEAFRTC